MSSEDMEICWLCGKEVSVEDSYVFYINNRQKDGEVIETKDGEAKNIQILSVEYGKVAYFPDLILCSECTRKVVNNFKNLDHEKILKLIRLIVITTNI